MVKLTINRKKIMSRKGATILEAALENGIFIPTLCHNDNLKPYGACRLCVVEVTSDGKTTVEASCCYPVSQGMVVKTDTKKIKADRRFIIDLLLSRCAAAPEVLEMLAKEYKTGNLPTRAFKGNDNCIRCGLCVRACMEIAGRAAIDFSGIGSDRITATPFNEKSDDCIGCGTCVLICPTREIEMEDSENDNSPVRNIPRWKTDFTIKTCKECGNPFFPADSLERLIHENNYLTPEFFAVCPSCRIPPTVDKELCVACNACIVICPMAAAQFVKDGDTQKARIYPENCTGCHTCIDLCCWGAIKVEKSFG